MKSLMNLKDGLAEFLEKFEGLEQFVKNKTGWGIKYQINILAYKKMSEKECDEKFYTSPPFFMNASKYLSCKEQYFDKILEKVKEAAPESNLNRTHLEKDFNIALKEHNINLSDINILGIVKEELDNLGISSVKNDESILISPKSFEECKSIDDMLKESGLSVFF